MKHIFHLHERKIYRKWMMVGTLALLLAAGIWKYPEMTTVLTGGTVLNELPIYSVETEEPVLSVTFDSAWGTEDFDEILRILGEHHVKAAFFMTGGFISEHPEAVQKLVSAGHDLGNHGDTHAQMSQLSKQECVEEIMGAHTKIKNLTGQDMTLFRAPYGDYNDTVLEAAKDCGYMTAQWNLDSVDWKEYGAADIISRICNHKDLRNGSIILLHTGTKYTAQALDELLTNLEDKGYGFIALSELLLKENYTINHEGRQIPDNFGTGA